MRNNLSVIAFAALIACVASTQAQQSGSSQGQNQPASNSSASSTPAASSNAGTSQSAPQTESLADAARKARAAKQDTSKTPKVFTNDNIPTSGGISAVGDNENAEAAGSGSSTSASAGAASGSSYPDGNDEKGWRAYFATLRHKLEEDQQLLDVSQRELGSMGPQYYNDPTKTMMQELTRSDINKKAAAIEQKKKDVEADKQAIEDAQDALRHAGGDPGWAQ